MPWGTRQKMRAKNKDKERVIRMTDETKAGIIAYVPGRFSDITFWLMGEV